MKMHFNWYLFLLCWRTFTTELLSGNLNTLVHAYELIFRYFFDRWIDKKYLTFLWFDIVVKKKKLRIKKMVDKDNWHIMIFKENILHCMNIFPCWKG